jgi:hypothetical protein
MRYIACLLLLLFGACGNDASQIAASPSPGAAHRSEPTQWFLRSISDDGKTIAFVYQMSGVASDCQREGTASLAQQADRVIVTAHRSVTLDNNRACTEELAYVDETVTLTKVLGKRLLIGCRPGYLEDTEDAICRDLDRSRDAGVFEFSPAPS